VYRKLTIYAPLVVDISNDGSKRLTDILSVSFVGPLVSVILVMMHALPDDAVAATRSACHKRPGVSHLETCKPVDHRSHKSDNMQQIYRRIASHSAPSSARKRS
jgi:hypothetical protein